MNRRELATKMSSASAWGQAVALCWIVDAVVGALLVPDEDRLLLIPMHAIELALAVLLLLASRAFGRGARTDDQRHLVSGFRYLRVYFAIQAVPFALSLIFTVLFILPHAFHC